MSQYSTINSEINRITENISDAYVAAADLGATLPINQNSDNLFTCLNTITKPPLIPINCSGLSFWIDGDCNTRNGLDRSKKYFENLVWNEPYTRIVGNDEILTNVKDNNWINNTNLLHIQNGWAYYPQQKCTASNEYTIEVVLKMTQETPNRRSEAIMSFGSQAVGSFHMYLSPDHIVYINPKCLDNSTPTFFAGGWSSLGLDPVVYTYFRIYTNSMDCGLSHSGATRTYASRPTGHNKAFHMGLGCSTSTATTPNPTITNGSYAIGMIRFWVRALTNNEIQANYLDAKNRFGCI